MDDVVIIHPSSMSDSNERIINEFTSEHFYGHTLQLLNVIEPRGFGFRFSVANGSVELWNKQGFNEHLQGQISPLWGKPGTFHGGHQFRSTRVSKAVILSHIARILDKTNCSANFVDQQVARVVCELRLIRIHAKDISSALRKVCSQTKCNLGTSRTMLSLPQAHLQVWSRVYDHQQAILYSRGLMLMFVRSLIYNE